MFFETLIKFLESTIKLITVIFPKVIMILIMTAQILFFNVFSKKDPQLHVVEKPREGVKFKSQIKISKLF